MDAAMTNFETKLRENAAKTEALLGRLLSGEARADEITRPQNLLDAMRHGVLNGGKRLRPFLVIESAALAEKCRSRPLCRRRAGMPPLLFAGS